MDVLNFSTVKHAFDNRPAAEKKSVPALFDWLDQEHGTQKDGLAIIGTRFRRGATRVVKGAVSASVMMLDIDGQDGSVSDIVEKLAGLGLTSFVYTSWSHGDPTTTNKQGQHKWQPGQVCVRVILPMAHDVDASDYGAVWSAVERWALVELGYKIDQATCDITRLMYLPRAKNPLAEIDPIRVRVDGVRLLNPTEILASYPAPERAPTEPYKPKKRRGASNYTSTVPDVSSVDAVGLVMELGYTEAKGRGKWACPCCGSRDNLHVYENNAFCFGQRRAFSAYDLVMVQQRCTFLDAWQWLADRGYVDARATKAPQREDSDLPAAPPEIGRVVPDDGCVSIDDARTMLRRRIETLMHNQGVRDKLTAKRVAASAHRAAVKVRDAEPTPEAIKAASDAFKKRAEARHDEYKLGARLAIQIPPGVGKSTAIYDAVQRQQLSGTKSTITLSLHNDRMRDEALAELATYDVKTHRIATRNAKNCKHFAEYIDAGRRGPTEASAFCKGCTHREKCPLIPQLGPRPAHVTVVTHAWLHMMDAGIDDVDLFIVDEDPMTTAAITFTVDEMRALMSVAPVDVVPAISAMVREMESRVECIGNKRPRPTTETDETWAALQVAPRDHDWTWATAGNCEAAFSACKTLTHEHLTAVRDWSGEDARVTLSGDGKLFARIDSALGFSPEASVVYLDATMSDEQCAMVLGPDYEKQQIKVRVPGACTIINVTGNEIEPGRRATAIDYGVDDEGNLDATAQRRVDAIRELETPDLVFGMMCAQKSVDGLMHYRGPDAKGTNAHKERESVLLLPYHESKARTALQKADNESAELTQTMHRVRPLVYDGRRIINATQRQDGELESTMPGAVAVDVSIGVVEIMNGAESIPYGFTQDVIDAAWGIWYETTRASADPHGYWGVLIERPFPNNSIILGNGALDSTHPFRRIIASVALATQKCNVRRTQIGGQFVPLPSNWQPTESQIARFAREVLTVEAKASATMRQAADAIREIGHVPTQTELAELMGVDRTWLGRCLKSAGVDDFKAWAAVHVPAQDEETPKAARCTVETYAEWREQVLPPLVERIVQKTFKGALFDDAAWAD